MFTYNTAQMLNMLSAFLYSQGLSETNCECPGAHLHNRKDKSSIDYNTNTAADGFLQIGISGCFHNSCYDYRKQYLNKLNRAWWQYVKSNGGVTGTVDKYEANKLRMVRQLEEYKEKKRLLDIDANKERVEQLIYKEMAIVPCKPMATVNNSPEDDFLMFKTLWTDPEIIFVGPRQGQGSLLTRKAYRITKADEFTTANVFKEEWNDGRYGYNTDYRKYLILENDKLDKATQYQVLIWINNNLSPVQMITDSGGKSLHGWLHYPGEMNEEIILNLICNNKSRKPSKGLNFDSAMFKSLQIARCPGGYRQDKSTHQRIVFFNKTEKVDITSNLNKLTDGKSYV